MNLHGEVFCLSQADILICYEIVKCRLYNLLKKRYNMYRNMAECLNKTAGDPIFGVKPFIRRRITFL